MDDAKVKEKGVKLTFGPCDTEQKSAVSGAGTNDYGAFTVKGVYDQSTNMLVCTKKYDSAGSDEDDDAEFNALPAAEEGEAQALEDEANMPIEELMKRYRQQGADNDEPAEPATKKQKVESDEEQYDEF